MSGRPLDELEEAVGAEVTVRLKSGDTYRGTLAGYDQHMNLVLEEAEAGPTGGGVPQDEVDEEAGAVDEDTTIIRGDNVVSITL